LLFFLTSSLPIVIHFYSLSSILLPVQPLQFAERVLEQIPLEDCMEERQHHLRELFSRTEKESEVGDSAEPK
jgi:hypothetical protein